jgi:hypothetical protein
MKGNVDIYYAEVKDIFIDESGSDNSEIICWDSNSSVDIQASNLKLVCQLNDAQLCVSENVRSAT